jgi:hypothetical protein
MSVVRAKTNPYGPATIDIQIEQGADFSLLIQLQSQGSPIPVEEGDVTASMSPQWAPGATEIPLVVEIINGPTGIVRVRYAAASSAALVLPFPPRKTRNPRVFELGGWVLNYIDSSDLVTRYCEGIVYLDRSPWLT